MKSHFIGTTEQGYALKRMHKLESLKNQRPKIVGRPHEIPFSWSCAVQDSLRNHNFTSAQNAAKHRIKICPGRPRTRRCSKEQIKKSQKPKIMRMPHEIPFS